MAISDELRKKLLSLKERAAGNNPPATVEGQDNKAALARRIAETAAHNEALEAAIKGVEERFAVKLEWRQVFVEDERPSDGQWFFMDSDKAIHGPLTFDELQARGADRSSGGYCCLVWNGSPPTLDDIFSPVDESGLEIARDLYRCAQAIRRTKTTVDALADLKSGPIQHVPAETRFYLAGMRMISVLLHMVEQLQPGFLRIFPTNERDDDCMLQELEAIFDEPYEHGSDDEHVIAALDIYLRRHPDAYGFWYRSKALLHPAIRKFGRSVRDAFRSYELDPENWSFSGGFFQRWYDAIPSFNLFDNFSTVSEDVVREVRKAMSAVLKRHPENSIARIVRANVRYRCGAGIVGITHELCEAIDRSHSNLLHGFFVGPERRAGHFRKIIARLQELRPDCVALGELHKESE